MKSVYSCLLLICMLLGMLSGCGSQGAAAPEEPQTQVQEEQPADEAMQPETEPVLMAFNPEDGSNNINNNCFTLYPGSYSGSAKTSMISDGESLYVSVFINDGRSGIFKCAPTDTDLSNTQMVFIPDIIDVETFPIALASWIAIPFARSLSFRMSTVSTVFTRLPPTVPPQERHRNPTAP